jgi:hypothetical protein
MEQLVRTLHAVPAVSFELSHETVLADAPNHLREDTISLGETVISIAEPLRLYVKLAGTPKA